MNSDVLSVLIYTLIAIGISLVLWGLVGIVIYKKIKDKKTPWIGGALLFGFLLFIWQRKKPVVVLLNLLLQFLTAMAAFVKIGKPVVRKIEDLTSPAKEKSDSSV